MAIAEYSQRESKARWARESSATARDIGPTPPIADIKRRRKCGKSLELFCRTYNPETFYLPWCRDQLDAIARIEEAVVQGALYGFAMPRGTGKTSLCRMAVLWAASYAYRIYPFLIGANAQKAQDSLDAIKTWMRYLPLYVDDFPEISHAAIQLGGLANRSAGQLCCGESTMIQWSKDRVVLPRVPVPPNWPRRWKKIDKRYAPTSGIVIGVSGLTGDGIRGSVFATADGRTIRPDLILLDDPQTDESAASRTQNESREALIAGAVLGMAGPDKTISAVMPCTVIRKDDMVDRILDRARHPLWRGDRRRMLVWMPKHLDAWERYFEVYRLCMSQEPPDIGPANDYYLEHRGTLDEGAVASWEARKLPAEASPIQHAMNLYCRDKRAFMAEYQNEPVEDDNFRAVLTAELVASKLNSLDRCVVPQLCQWVTAYLDVHLRLLYWVVSAWDAKFGGGPIDYGTHPKQPVGYFAQDSAPVAMENAYPATNEDSWILRGLTDATGFLLGREFKREDGAVFRVGRLLIDCKWGQKAELVKAFCRRHSQAGSVVMAAQGLGIGAASKPFEFYRPEPGAQAGLHWRIPPPKDGSRWVTIDTNWWKSLAGSRLALPVGTPGGWELFGRDPRTHALFADHCTAEEPVEVTARDRTVDEWKWKPGRPDNHWWDALVGSAVAGSMLGATVDGVEVVSPGQRKRVKLSELQAQKRRA